MTEAQEPTAMVLPCPFCGGAGRIKTITFGYSSLHNGEEGYRGECSKCGVSFHEYWLERVDAIAAWNRRAALASPPAQEAEVRVKEMKLSDGRSDFFVSVAVGDRELTPYMSRIKGRAEFEVANWRWLFGQGEKPRMRDWLERTADPSDAALNQPEPTTGGNS